MHYCSGGDGTETMPKRECLYQGVFVAGQQPLWLFAHRGTYCVHELDCREGAGTEQRHVPVTAMCAWHRGHSPASRRSFILFTSSSGSDRQESKLGFCQMPANVRFLRLRLLCWND